MSVCRKADKSVQSRICKGEIFPRANRVQQCFRNLRKKNKPMTQNAITQSVIKVGIRYYWVTDPEKI